MSDQKKLTEEEAIKLEVHVKKAQAVREAMFEVVGEQRDEIVRRACAKLAAQGIDVKPDEIGAT